MCNCAGVQTYSNCAGNPDCNCAGAYSTNSRSSKTFNNMVGMNGFANASGEIQTLTAPTVQVSTSLPTIKVSAPTTTPTASTTPTSGTTLNKVLDLGSGLLGMFTKPAASAPVYTPPTEEKKIPTAVWVVVGGLLLLVVAFVIVKAKK